MISRLNSLNIQRSVELILEDDKEKLEELQLAQLWSGQDSEGNDLAPSYLNDPYFRTPEAAQRYSNWKDKITPVDSRSDAYADRKKGVPNLFITGYWYSGLKLDLTGRGFINSSPLNPAIEAKYPKALGLNPKGRKYYIDTEMMRQLMFDIRVTLKV